MLSRTETTTMLLDAIEQGEFQFADLQLDQRQAILSHPDRLIAGRAKELMKARGAMVESNRQGLVDSWMPVCQMQGNVENGLAVYKKNCAQCHKHGEIGTAIGPNLTGMAVHPKQEILMNVLDPSRSVESNFRTYQILTSDGAVITGMLAGESANSLRLIDSQGKEQQILREDIEEIDLSIKSLMPEGFESSITKQEMADLLAFLNNRGRYTPLNLISGATLSSAKGLPGFRGAAGDKFEFSSFGTFEFDGVPFELQDPQDGRVANMIALQASSGRFPTTLPASTEVFCSGPVSHIHLLTALAAFGPPGQNSNSSMTVRLKFEDDSVENHELFNGKQLASYRDKSDATDSKIAMDASGKQIRYTKIDVVGDKPLKSIEFIKGRDFSIPMVFAITVESQADHR